MDHRARPGCNPRSTAPSTTLISDRIPRSGTVATHSGQHGAQHRVEPNKENSHARDSAIERHQYFSDSAAHSTATNTTRHIQLYKSTQTEEEGCGDFPLDRLNIGLVALNPAHAHNKAPSQDGQDFPTCIRSCAMTLSRGESA